MASGIEVDGALARGTGQPRRTRQRAPLPAALRRSVKLAVALRPGEHADLAAIGEAWGVAPGTVAWVLVHAALAGMREQSPDLPLGLAAAIHARLLPDLARAARDAARLVDGAEGAE